GYVRSNGDVGIRNEIWIINTVGCVNKIAEKLAAKTGAPRDAYRTERRDEGRRREDRSEARDHTGRLPEGG
ncbi:MAG: UxaA family hydrolase, partial [Fibrobacter sp.]|nr:UxaA family hydrolase [Fibrobacter sp.]